MKRTLIALFAFALVNGAKAQNSPAVDLANKIADKMRDTLGLTQTQRSQIFDINMQLHTQKQSIVGQSQNRDTIARRLQRIENTRDSLYNEKLTPPQFQLYKEKKRRIVNSN
jgi:choline dehydrogenase-like flavoprotein